MKRIFFTLLAAVMSITVMAQDVSIQWSLSDKDNLSEVSVEGEKEYTDLLTPSFYKGYKIDEVATMTASNADAGYTAVTYTPPFSTFTPVTRVTEKTSGHCIRVGVSTASGHSFKPTMISFDAAKVGTDGGNFDVYYKVGNSEEKAVATSVTPLRNKITSANSTGYSHYEYVLGDVIAEGQSFYVYIYIYNLNGTDQNTDTQVLAKAMAFRNITIDGAVDEKIFTAGDFVESFTCSGKTSANADNTTIDLTSLVKNLKNGETAKYETKLYGEPTDFNLQLPAGCTYNVEYNGHTATISILRNGKEVISFSVLFKVSSRLPKPDAKPLGRGLISVSLTGAGMGTGNLVMWRHREKDDTGVKYKLYRGTLTIQDTPLNDGKYIINRTNFRDASGTTSSCYKLEVYDRYGNLLETEVSRKTWSNQTMNVKTSRPAASIHGATYTPNDASFCDMDGDGEYEIILKWSPSDEKDAASTGTTSEVIFDCYKLDGTQLWRIHSGDNFFTSAHTMQFIAWDFDGDGYGEFMMKTGPGTIDGEGNYVIMGDDDPHANWLNSRGKQVDGPEYITVFDGMTGGEICTIPYHTKYGDVSTSIWGDSNQNRSERYLAAIAWLDGAEENPCPIFARGYYSGAFVAAYDFDGDQLSERWVSRNVTSGQGLWGEGAHWISVGDCDADGRQEIVYGSAALDHDGTLLYRTGLGHGDALHLADLIPEREGMEVFMVHEKSPYGYDLRDAKTGQFILNKSASSDTGRGLAAHFDSSSQHSQFIYSASGGVFDCATGAEIASSWAIGSSGAGINNRIYWDGDLYDEYFDKSIIAHWNPTGKYFDRYKFNNGYYVWGKLNNGTKYNPCVMGDILGDWREEIITWNEDDCSLCICATSYESSYRLPHLMDDLNYRAQVIAQNVCYNQPPHLSFDPAVKYKNNPNVAKQEDETMPTGITVFDSHTNDSQPIYDLQGRIVAYGSLSSLATHPSSLIPHLPRGIYIQGGNKYYVK